MARAQRDSVGSVRDVKGRQNSSHALLLLLFDLLFGLLVLTLLRYGLLSLRLRAGTTLRGKDWGWGRSRGRLGDGLALSGRGFLPGRLNGGKLKLRPRSLRKCRNFADDRA